MGKYKANSHSKLLARYGRLYFPFKPPGFWQDSSCCYCGNPAQSRDHIPPLAWMYCLGPGYFERERLLVVWVPCCLECNSALGDQKLFTIKERTFYLLRYYEHKFEKLHEFPRWHDHEIGELHGRLKQFIENSETYRAGAGRRLSILAENCDVRTVRE